MTLKTTLSPVLIQQEGWRDPRSRTSETVRALGPTLGDVQATPGVVYTVLQGLTPDVTRSVVRALRTASTADWTFRTSLNGDGTLDVQAMYDPTAPYTVRKYTKRNPAQKLWAKSLG